MTVPSSPAQEASGLVVTAWTAALGGLGAAGFGVWRMLSYRSYNDTDKLTGGDAYNMQILAIRGVGWVCVGILLVGVGIMCAVLSNRRRA